MSLIDLIDSRVEDKIGTLLEFKDKGKDVKKGIGFMTYALENIYKSYNINNTEIENGIIDSSYREEKYDYGIDAIYITANKECIENLEQLNDFNEDTKFEIHIFQFKKGTGIDAESILKLKDGIEQVFIENKLLEEENEYMYDRLVLLKSIRREIFNQFSPKNITTKIYFVFSGSKEVAKQDNYVQQKIETLEKCLINSGYSNVSFVILGAEELLDLEKGKTDISDVIRVKKFFKYVTATSGKDKLNGYIAIVQGEEIAKLVEKYQNSLFELNIRDYYSSNSNNEKIIATSSSDTESKYFWSFNNGLTITCKQVDDLPDDQLKINGLQIVNGCQTSNSLYKAYKNRAKYNELSTKGKLKKTEQEELEKIENERLNDKTSVLVKIIETDNDELVYKITESTNSQTAISAFSLKANEDIHKNIERFMKEHNIYYERRINFYRNQKIPTKDIIDIKKMAQIYYSIVKYRPSQAMSNPKSMFLNHYKTIFPSPTETKNLDYKLYLVPVLIQRAVEQRIRMIQRTKSEKNAFNKKLLSYGKFHLGTLALFSILDKEYNEKGIKNNLEKVKEEIKEAVFDQHFNNALKNLKNALNQIGCFNEDSVIQYIKLSELDQQIIKIINGNNVITPRKGKKR